MDIATALQTLATIGAISAAVGTTVGAVNLMSDSVSGLWRRLKRAIDSFYGGTPNDVPMKVPREQWEAIIQSDRTIVSPAKSFARMLRVTIQRGMNDPATGVTTTILATLGTFVELVGFSVAGVSDVHSAVEVFMGLVVAQDRLSVLTREIMREDVEDWTALRNWLKREIPKIEAL